MTEERLEEIKDSIILQKIACKTNKEATKLIDEELELYNEVVRLREIHNKALEWFKYADRNSLDKLYNILKQNNLTLEQLGGVDNDR
jgi:hypothetical protein